MNLIISFSGRANGNCDDILRYIADINDTTISFKDLNVHECSKCSYECMYDVCKYRCDDIYNLYKSMSGFDKIFIIVPIYCGNPSSLYFKFTERSQDYFMHNEDYELLLSKLFIIGVYGDKENDPDFIPCLEKWFKNTKYNNHVLGIERHKYGQKMKDKIIDVDQVKNDLNEFINQK